MIHVLSRKELLTTFRMEEQARVREILTAHGIDYTIKTVNRASPSPLSSGSRGRAGTTGVSTNAMYEYVVFVKRTDHEAAARLIGR